MIIYGGNNYKSLFINIEAANAFNIHHVPKDTLIFNNPLVKSFITSIRNMDVKKLSLKEKIKIIKHQIKTIKHDKDIEKSDKTALIIVSIIIALALLLLLGALSCSIACSGSEALSVIVLIGGTFLIIFFLVHFIKRINNPRVKKEVENKNNITGQN